MTKDELTGVIRRRYDRQARLYDLKNAVMDTAPLPTGVGVSGRRWTANRSWNLGVGTDANFPFYPPSARGERACPPILG